MGSPSLLGNLPFGWDGGEEGRPTFRATLNNKSFAIVAILYICTVAYSSHQPHVAIEHIHMARRIEYEFYFILINLNCYMWRMATLLISTALDLPLNNFIWAELVENES